MSDLCVSLLEIIQSQGQQVFAKRLPVYFKAVFKGKQLHNSQIIYQTLFPTCNSYWHFIVIQYDWTNNHRYWHIVIKTQDKKYKYVLTGLHTWPLTQVWSDFIYRIYLDARWFSHQKHMHMSFFEMVYGLKGLKTNPEEH